MWPLRQRPCSRRKTLRAPLRVLRPTIGPRSFESLVPICCNALQPSSPGALEMHWIPEKVCIPENCQVRQEIFLKCKTWFSAGRESA
eukprot:686451-Prymnesium_polylepis.1